MRRLTRTASRWALTVTLLAVAASGCGTETQPEGTAGSAPATPAATAPSGAATDIARPDPSLFTLAPEGSVNEDTGQTISPDPAVWDEESRAAAIAAAEAALEAFAHPELDYDTWWAGLDPHLTQEAAEAYVYVDPANIPVHELTGSGTIIEDASAYVATVKIPTDAGRYDVLVIRTSGSAPWLASRIVPVEEAEQ
ncbi:hypothetical protein [Actinomyces succiniciruminis]|uniref:Prokaryotic membrane lipoprotein lipid attachment site profile n=1 Tax=Actinomyces succiniciruminis TaxID=1522002 RepID=A0A1L7R8G1_9ACTO|nr:hypothetical protein [Actinomyces succiniciruminis]CED90071.1 Prokaryotic membrane lipoprotein lipid attachment site profile [Actinomyces succiniciruminis]